MFFLEPRPGAHLSAFFGDRTQKREILGTCIPGGSKMGATISAMVPKGSKMESILEGPGAEGCQNGLTLLRRRPSQGATLTFR